MSKHRKKKKKGCSKGIFIFFLLVLTTVILVSTGVVSEIKKSIDRKFYPLEYKEHIINLCEEYDFDPAFICAVIHTESKFKADAESHAGAKGLMQLMPETFKEMAKRRGDTVNAEDITDPQTNITYGIYYLHQLKTTYGFTDKYTCAAAYNAGPGAVGRWLDNSEYSEDGTTLEDIPFGETKEYVEKIKKTESMYQSLYFD